MVIDCQKKISSRKIPVGSDPQKYASDGVRRRQTIKEPHKGRIFKMEDSLIKASFLSASAAEKKRRSVNHERRRRDFGLELLKKRQIVTTILGNDKFRAQLEDILKTRLGGDRKARKPRQFHDIDEQQFDTTSALKNMPQCGSPYGGIAMGNNIITINDLHGVDGSKYSIAERQLRCKLASLYRLVDWLGWSQGIYNHITVSTLLYIGLYLYGIYHHMYLL